jgi:uridine kinase
VTPTLTVGIAGGTGAGKTSVCDLLRRTLDGVTILDLDSYYVDRSDLAPERRAGLNFDEPAAFDVPLLLAHLSLLRGGHAIDKPRYSFESHTRCGFERIAPAPIVLVEGLFALWWEELRRTLDLKVFIEAPADARLARRLERDVVARGRTIESVHLQYTTTVLPMHARYVEPTRALADVVVRNDRDLAACVAAIRSALRATPPADRGRHVPTA